MQYVLFYVLYGILKGNENYFSYHKSLIEVICMILVFKKKKVYSLNIFLINFNLNYAFLEMDFSS